MRWRPRRVIAAALVGVLAGAAAQCSAAAAAHDGRALLGLINDYRASAQRCGGQEVAAAGPLAPDTTLADAPLVAGSALHEALRAAGYAASRSAAITLTGPRDAAAAMQLLAQHYCAALSSARYAEIGIARDGEHWRIVLAQPLLASDLGSPREAGQRVLELVNAARAQARQCGDQAFAAVPAVAWNARLMATALAHSRDMARRDDFAHVGRRGDRVGARLRRHGYDWRTVVREHRRGPRFGAAGDGRLAGQPRPLRQHHERQLHRDGCGLRDRSQQRRDDLLDTGVCQPPAARPALKSRR